MNYCRKKKLLLPLLSFIQLNLRSVLDWHLLSFLFFPLLFLFCLFPPSSLYLMPSVFSRFCCCFSQPTPVVAKNPYAEFDKDEKKKDANGRDGVEGSISQSPDWIPSPLQNKVKKGKSGGAGGTELTEKEGKTNYYAKKAAKVPAKQVASNDNEAETDEAPPPPPLSDPPTECSDESDSDTPQAASGTIKAVEPAEKFDESTKTGALKSKLAAQLGGKIPVFGAPRPVTQKSAQSSRPPMNSEPPDENELKAGSNQNDSGHLSTGSLNSIMKPVKSPRTRGKHPPSVKSFQPSPSNTPNNPQAPVTLANAANSAQFSQSASNIHSQPPSTSSSSKSRPPASKATPNPPSSQAGNALVRPKTAVRCSIDDSFNPKYQQGSVKAVAKYREATINNKPQNPPQAGQYANFYQSQAPSQAPGQNSQNQSQRPPGPGQPSGGAFAGGPPPGRSAAKPPSNHSQEPRNRRSSSFDGSWKQKPVENDQFQTRNPPGPGQNQARPPQQQQQRNAPAHNCQPSSNPSQNGFGGAPPQSVVQPFGGGGGLPKGPPRPPVASRPPADYPDPPSQISQQRHFDSDSEESDSDEEMPKRKNKTQKAPNSSWGEAARQNTTHNPPPTQNNFQTNSQARGPPIKPPSLADMSVGSLPPAPPGYNLY
jgi:hypothetical protein